MVLPASARPSALAGPPRGTRGINTLRAVPRADAARNAISRAGRKGKETPFSSPHGKGRSELLFSSFWSEWGGRFVK